MTDPARAGSRLAIVAALAAGSAAGGDWTVTGSFGQGLSVRSGFGETAREDSVTSDTRLGLNFTTRSDTTSWLLAPGLSFSARAGGDEDDPTDLNFVFRGRLSHQASPDFNLGATLSVTPQFVNSRETAGFDVASPDGSTDEPDQTSRARLETGDDPLELRIRGAVTANYRTDQRTTLTSALTFDLREVALGSEDFDPSRTAGIQLGVRRSIDELSSGLVGVGVRYFTSEAEDSADTISLTPNLGYSRRFTARHNGTLRLGLSAARADETDAGTDFAFDGGATFNYTGDGYNARLRASQELEQDDAGEVVSASRVTGTISAPLAEGVNANLAGSIAFDRSLFEAVDAEDATVTISPGLTMRLSRDWSLRLGYALRLELQQESGTEGDNRVFLNLSRALDILP